MFKKLDPELRARLRVRRRETPFNAARDQAAPSTVELIVQFTGEVEDLERAGFEKRSLIQHQSKGYKIATGRIAVDRLEELAAIDHVVEIEGPHRYFPMLDYSLAEVRADAVHKGAPPFKGNGVVIGVIDSGIDWRHGAFKKADGTSRILAVWDQMLTARAGETAGPGAVGVLYTQFTDPGAVRTRDHNAKGEVNGHGTHVAGIAAGNGRPASCCHTSGTYVGVAPEASLVVVRYDYTNAELGANIRAVEAMDFIFHTSPALGKPTVINLSQGINRGPHDGTTMVEQAIDAMIAGHPARAIVVAAGNFANTRCHVKGMVPGRAGAVPGSLEIEFEVREGHDSNAYLDLWYQRAGTLNLTVTAHGGASSGAVAHGTDSNFIANPTASADDRCSVEIDGTINAPSDRDNNFRVTLTKPAKSNIPPGDGWKLQLSNPNPGPVAFHCWMERGEHAPVFLPDKNPPDGKIRASTDSTLSTPSTAVEAITVANHESRTGCCDCWPLTGIVASSSRGPVARTSAGVINNKPDIAAPGLLISAPQADASNLAGNTCSCCPDACCSLYQDMTGTSMAAPHVAGAIALMLEKNPMLTKAQILTHLQNTARPAPADGTRETWGAGKLDVRAAVDAVPATLVEGRAGNPAVPIEDTAEPGNLRRPLRPFSSFDRDQEQPDVDSEGSCPPAVRIVRARLAAVPNGVAIAAVISRHLSEVRRLINGNRRVATLWHRSDGPRMISRLVNGSIDPAAPPAIASKQQRLRVERWLDILHEHGSRRLQLSIEGHRGAITTLLTVPLAVQALHGEQSD